MMNRKGIWKLTTLTLSLTILGSFFFLLATASAADDLGEQVFVKKCKMCHGEDGSGDTSMGKKLEILDLKTGEWKNGKTVEALQKTLLEGLGKMPKYEGKLSDEELKAVSTYVVEKLAK